MQGFVVLPIGHLLLILTTQVDSGSFSSPLVESLVAAMIEQGAVTVHLEGLRASLSRRAVLLAGLTLTLSLTRTLTLHPNP